jgi:hypothetical protein
MRCQKAFVGAQGIAPLSPALEMSNVYYYSFSALKGGFESFQEKALLYYSRQ